DFSRAFRNNPDFYLTSDVEDARPVRFDRAWAAVIVFLAMITAFVSGKVDIMMAAFLAAGGMVIFRCISPADARKSIDLPVTLAASYAFASPIGYQTHMMVFGPGGYRFTDFVRVGVPLNLLMMTAAVILIPMIWPFHLSGQ